MTHQKFAVGQEQTDKDIMQIEEVSSDESIKEERCDTTKPNLVRNTKESNSLENTKILTICKVFVMWPKLSFGLTLGGHCLMIFVTIILFVVGYDILPIDFSAVPLNLEDDPTKLRADAWKYASESDSVTLSSSTAGAQTQRILRYQVVELVYESKKDNVLTKKDLKDIEVLEWELRNSTIWNEKLCLLNSKKTCQKPSSILRFFDGTYRNLHEGLFDPDFENISKVLTAAHSMKTTRSLLAYHLGNDVAIDNTSLVVLSKYTRSLMIVAWPLDGYNNTLDQKDEQAEKLDSMTVEAFAEKFRHTYELGLPGINFFYYNRAIYVDAIQKQVIFDFLLAGGSMMFIFLFMWIQVGSIWITCWSIFSILSSFVTTNFIYRVILDYRYFGVFHVLSVFIILGIGADDVFVFMDSWKQSALMKFPSLISRLSYVYSHAESAMFITSFTTMVAFLSSALSPLLAVSTFGTFSALLVLVNYCSVVVFLPNVVIIHELYTKRKCSFDCRLRNPTTVHPSQSDSNDDVNGDVSNDVNNNDVNGLVNSDDTKLTKTQQISGFLKGSYFRKCVGHKKGRWVILVFFGAICAIFVTFATFIEPDEKQVYLWIPGTNWYEIKRLRETAFQPSEEDDIVTVHIIWGLKEQDRRECHFTDYKCKGKTVFDNSFDLNPPPCQTAVLKFCKKLKNLPQNDLHRLKIRRSSRTGAVEIKCLLERMNEYYEVEGNISAKYPTSTDFSLPVNGQKMTLIMQNNPQIYNISVLPDTYYRYFEVAVGYFMTDGLTPGYWTSYDFHTYSKLAGGEKDPSAVTSRPNLQGHKYGNRLLFMAIAVNTTLSQNSLGYEHGLPIFNHWEDFVTTEMNAMPPSCQQGFQATVDRRNAWHWLKVQQILVRNAVQGVLLGLTLALVVLTVATKNWIISLLATLTIGLITCCVVGVIPMAGWKLGVLESLNLTMVVGLAVDYVVHLAQGYVYSTASGRLERVQDTLGHVGISVLSGACTTLGASIFMFGAKILFFFQFGIFIFSTVGFSLVFALVFFVTILGVMGPDGTTGSIAPWLQYIGDYLRGKTTNHVDCWKCKGKGFVKRELLPLVKND